eukprot:1962246-Prymnesium_polylepis.1
MLPQVLLACILAWSDRLDVDCMACRAVTRVHCLRRFLLLAPPLLAASELPPSLVDGLWRAMATLGGFVDSDVVRLL